MVGDISGEKERVLDSVGEREVDSVPLLIKPVSVLENDADVSALSELV